jgi:hypothetical protein
MKYFYIYVFILLCFIIAVSYLNTYLNTFKEPFNSDKQTFVLLGDSILKNNAYVSDGKSVDILLKERTNGKSFCLAMDNSKIADINSQIQQIPETLNNNFTTIFLSAGGNDILTYYVDQENDVTNSSILESMFVEYKKLIEIIRAKLPNANIVVLDIYYPDNVKYKRYHSLIQEWNNSLYDYVKTQNGVVNVLKISNILTQPEDFVFGFEPSSNGSVKLVDAIINNY